MKEDLEKLYEEVILNLMDYLNQVSIYDEKCVIDSRK